MLAAFNKSMGTAKFQIAKDNFVNITPIAADILTYRFTDSDIRKKIGSPKIITEDNKLKPDRTPFFRTNY